MKNMKNINLTKTDKQPAKTAVSSINHLPNKNLASTNRHAIEISNNIRTRRFRPFGFPLRGNPYNLGLPVLHVKSVRCDPRRSNFRRGPSCLVGAVSRVPVAGPAPSRSPGHEEEHYAGPGWPSTRKGHFRGALGHSRDHHDVSAGQSAFFQCITVLARQEERRRTGKEVPCTSQNAPRVSLPSPSPPPGTVPRCSATIPPVRFRYCLCWRPASPNQARSSSWAGQSRIDSVR